MSENKESDWGKSFFQKKNYSQEEWERKKEGSYGIAVRTSVVSYMVQIFRKQLILSFVLFLVTCVGIDAVKHFLHIPGAERNFYLTKGIFIPFMEVFIVLSLVAAIYFSLAYKRLELRCLHLGIELDGARKLNEAATRANLINQVMKVEGVPYATTGGVVKGANSLANYYLMTHGKKTVNGKIFKGIEIGLTILQLVIAAAAYAWTFL